MECFVLKYEVMPKGTSARLSIATHADGSCPDKIEGGKSFVTVSELWVPPTLGIPTTGPVRLLMAGLDFRNQPKIVGCEPLKPQKTSA